MPCTSQFKSKELKMLTSLKVNVAILMIAFFLANYEVVWWFGDSGAEPWVRVTRVIITVVRKVLLALALFPGASLPGTATPPERIQSKPHPVSLQAGKESTIGC